MSATIATVWPRYRSSRTRVNFSGCLPLLITGESSLPLEAPGARRRIHERVIQVESLARMNAGALLYRVEFVDLKCRERKAFVPGQIKGLSGRQRMGPITRPTLSFAPALNRPVGARKPYIARTVAAFQDQPKITGR